MPSNSGGKIKPGTGKKPIPKPGSTSGPGANLDPSVRVSGPLMDPSVRVSR